MNLYQQAIDYAIIDILGKITWQKTFAAFHDGKEYLITKEEQEKIAHILDFNSCIILTRRDSHLSTYGTSLAHLLKTGHWGYYSHALLNIERDDEPYRMVEATGMGTHWTGFNDVFNCDSACLLKPKGVTLEDWKEIFDNAPSLLGIPYDSLFDFNNPNRLSCIELVYVLLQKAAPNSPSTMALAYMLKKYGCLTPQMVRDTNAFDIILEIRH
jgi:hypothetical protein